MKLFFSTAVCVLAVVLSAGDKISKKDFEPLQAYIITLRLGFVEKDITIFDKAYIEKQKERIKFYKEELEQDESSSDIKECRKNIAMASDVMKLQKMIRTETPAQLKKVSFIQVHVLSASLSPAARRQFLAMIKNGDFGNKKIDAGKMIMKYPLFIEEANKNQAKVDAILKGLKMKTVMGQISYDSPQDLENAYSQVKELYR